MENQGIKRVEKVNRIQHKSQAGSGAPIQNEKRNAGNEVRKWQLREIDGTKTVMLNWSFTTERDVPFQLPKRDYRETEYTLKRTQEVLKMGGGISDEQIMTQRPGTMDTGKHIAELKQTEGGATLFTKLLEQGWKVVDAFWEIRESEDSKAKQKGHKKWRVKCTLSKNGNEMQLPEVTLKGLKRLMYRTWIAHIWDNRKVNNSITVHFTFWQKETPPTYQIVLPTIS